MTMKRRVSAGVAYSNYVAQRAPADTTTVGAESSGMDVGRLVRSGIYVPISEALLMFYQVRHQATSLLLCFTDNLLPVISGTARQGRHHTAIFPLCICNPSTFPCRSVANH